MYSYRNGTTEHLLYPISEFGYGPTSTKRGVFKVKDVVTTFDKELKHATMQHEYVRNYYYDLSGNVYKTPYSKEVLFNLLKR